MKEFKMKTINIVKGLQLKTNEDETKIQLRYKHALISEWDNIPLNEYGLSDSAIFFKNHTTKKIFKEAVSYEVGGDEGIKHLYIICKDDSDWTYKKSISILLMKLDEPLT